MQNTTLPEQPPIQELAHPQAHTAVSRGRKKPNKYLPPIVYEIGAALTVGWLVYLATSDWKQGVGASLVSLFGGGASRFGYWYAEKK